MRDPGIQVVECKIERNLILDRMRVTGLSQERAAKRAGFTQRQLGRVIHGENVPGLEFAVALSRVFKMPVEKLFRFRIKTKKIREMERGKVTRGRPRGVVDTSPRKARKSRKPTRKAA